MSQNVHPMLNIAIKAARAAGAIINRGSQDLDLLKVTSKGPNDFVSEVDRAAEAAIIEVLLGAYPGHGILAEESGREFGAKHSDYVWIIDPLDGTTNFLHGFPVYAVSIALAFRGKVEQAVVYDPNRNDLFYASRGRGAFLNDKRLRVSKRIRLADSLIGTGFPFRRGDNFQRYLKMFETVMSSCAGLRRPGAAALDLCYVAAGWYDGFFETGLSPWDVAAGSLIITEAGGLIGNFTGESDFLYQREVVAGTPKVYGQLVTLLAPYSKAITREEGETSEAGAGTGTGAGAEAGSEPAAALAAALGVSGEAATDAAAAPAAEPVRERKPVRIRKAAVAAVASVADGAEATEGAEARPVPTVTIKPAEPRAPRRDDRRDDRKDDRREPRREPRSDDRAPRSFDRDRPREPRRDGPAGDRRGPAPSAGERRPAAKTGGSRPAGKTVSRGPRGGGGRI